MDKTSFRKELLLSDISEGDISFHLKLLHTQMPSRQPPRRAKDKRRAPGGRRKSAAAEVETPSVFVGPREDENEYVCESRSGS
jgi:hypothetical protein